MNTSAKSVKIARGIYFRALYMDLADSDNSEQAKIIRSEWIKWINDNTMAAYDYVCNQQMEIFDDINRNSEIY
jgi:hypothetical protein